MTVAGKEFFALYFQHSLISSSPPPAFVRNLQKKPFQLQQQFIQSFVSEMSKQTQPIQNSKQLDSLLEDDAEESSEFLVEESQPVVATSQSDDQPLPTKRSAGTKSRRKKVSKINPQDDEVQSQKLVAEVHPDDNPLPSSTSVRYKQRQKRKQEGTSSNSVAVRQPAIPRSKPVPKKKEEASNLRDDDVQVSSLKSKTKSPKKKPAGKQKKLNTNRSEEIRKVVNKTSKVAATHPDEHSIQYEEEIQATLSQPAEVNEEISVQSQESVQHPSDPVIPSDNNLNTEDIEEITDNLDISDGTKSFEDGMALTGLQLISILQTSAIKIPSRAQTALFEQKTRVKLEEDEVMQPNTIYADPVTKLRSVTPEHRRYLESTMKCGKGEKDYYWNHSVGNVILAICASDIGLEIDDEDLIIHELWVKGCESSLKYVFSFKEGSEPTIPTEWIDENGRYQVPCGIQLYLVDGAVRLTFVSEKDLECLPRFHLWVLPSQLFKDKPAESSVKTWIRTFLLPVARATNFTMQNAVQDTFFTKVEQTARRRSQLLDGGLAHWNPDYDSEELPEKIAKFTENTITVKRLFVTRPKTNVESILKNSMVPKEQEGLAKYTKAYNAKDFPFALYNTDLLFVSGRLCETDGTDLPFHVCSRCTILSEIVRKDLAVTVCLDYLYNREYADTGSVSVIRHDLSDAPTVYRQVRSIFLKVVTNLYGKHPTFSIARKGAKSSTAKLNKRFFFEGEGNFMISEIMNTAMIGFIARLDAHEAKVASNHPDESVLRPYKKVTTNISGFELQYHPRDSSPHITLPFPSSQKEMYALCATRSSFATEGILRICTQLLGLRSIQSIISLTKRCPWYNNPAKNMETVDFFQDESWHLRPCNRSLASWNGTGTPAEKYEYNVLVDDNETRAWGMNNIDEAVCKVVLRSLSKFDKMFQSVLLHSEYDYDMWAQFLGDGIRPAGGYGCGEAVDHLSVKLLHLTCEEMENGLWIKLRMPERLERSFEAMKSGRKNQNNVGDAFSYPIIMKMEDNEQYTLKYMQRFIIPSTGPEGRKKKVWEELPELAKLQLATGKEKENNIGLQGSSSNEILSYRRSYRSKNTLPLWELRLGALVDGFRKLDDTESLVSHLSEFILGVVDEVPQLEDPDSHEQSTLKARIIAHLTSEVKNPITEFKGNKAEVIKSVLDISMSAIEKTGTNRKRKMMSGNISGASRKEKSTGYDSSDSDSDAVNSRDQEMDLVQKKQKTKK